MICLAVCAIPDLCHSDIQCVFPPHYDIVNVLPHYDIVSVPPHYDIVSEIPVFGTRVYP